MVVGIALLTIAVVGYFLSGSAPVATDAPPMPLEKYLAKKALHAVLDRGAQLYKDNCAVCHGLPGQPATAIARGMFPHPPELLHGKGVTDDEPRETYWKVVHRIRLTGMPGFRGSLTDSQAWQVSILLAHADQLPDSVKAQLTSPPPQASPAVIKGTR